jgi:hypothetical protein
VVTNFVTGSQGRTFPPSRWKARMAPSVPEPMASGAKPKQISPEASAPRAGRQTMTSLAAWTGPSSWAAWPGSLGSIRPIHSCSV